MERRVGFGSGVAEARLGLARQARPGFARKGVSRWCFDSCIWQGRLGTALESVKMLFRIRNGIDMLHAACVTYLPFLKFMERSGSLCAKRTSEKAAA